MIEINSFMTVQHLLKISGMVSKWIDEVFIKCFPTNEVFPEFYYWSFNLWATIFMLEKNLVPSWALFWTLQFLFQLDYLLLVIFTVDCRTWLKLLIVYLIPQDTRHKFSAMNFLLRHWRAWFIYTHLCLQLFGIVAMNL